METFYIDKPSRGTLISGFAHFLGGVFQLEFSEQMPNLLMAASSDGVKMWMIEKKIHRQTMQFAMRGLTEEQTILQQNMVAGKTSGFNVCKALPMSERKYVAKVNQTQDAGLIQQN